MVVKYNRNRLLFIKIYSVAVGILFGFNLWAVVMEREDFLNIITTILLSVNCFGFLYYQVVRYDNQKVVAQFGWPKIYFKDIIEVKYVFGDIVIKTNKRTIGVNTQVVDKASLQKFIKTLEQQTEFQLNLS